MYIVLLIFALIWFNHSVFPQFLPIRGADVSFLKQIEDNNGVFKESGTPKDALHIFNDHNVNLIRLRLWHSPADGYSGLEKTIALAQRAKNLGIDWLLDFHYSDTWADPGQQTKPAAWAGLSTAALGDTLYAYTKSTLLTLKSLNLLPSMVQIGNEISGGMLWNTGRVGGSYDTPTQWTQFTDLLKKGLQAVAEVNSLGHNIKTIIHTDAGGDSSGCKWFFDNIISRNVPFDIIGLSYYPWWHGDFSKLNGNLSMLATRYQKEIIIVETAYPWTLAWNDTTHNMVGMQSQLLPGYPATVTGQHNFLNSLKQSILNTPNSMGLGFIYWEPDHISTATFGSPWENLALFDFSGEVLTSIMAFEIALDIKDDSPVPQSFRLYQNHPNPFNPSTKISFTLPATGYLTLKVFDILGNHIQTLYDGIKESGTHTVDFHATTLAGGVYFCRMEAAGFSHTIKISLVK